VASGSNALFENTTGNENTAIGYTALNQNTEGAGNTAIGSRALLGNTTGDRNTATGYLALDSNTTGSNNTAIGFGSLNSSASGNDMTAIGYNSLNRNTTGNNNTATGYGSLDENTTGDNNTAVGYRAGVTSVPSNGNTTGSNNTYIGYLSGPGTATQLTNSTAIGASARVTASNALVLGSLNVSVGIGTTAPADKLDVDGDIRIGTGTTGCVKDSDATVIAGTCSSDARLKRNIEPFANVLDRLVKVRPVHFDWKADEYPERNFGQSRSFGLIAQEVEQVFPNLVTADAEGMKAVRYNELPFLMLQAIRELKASNDAMKTTSDGLRATNEQLQRELRELREAVERLQQTSN
jgi:hypothetical protein